MEIAAFFCSMVLLIALPGSFYGPVAGPPGGCLQSAAILTNNRHSVCHSAHRIVETHRLEGDCPINGGSDLASVSCRSG